MPNRESGFVPIFILVIIAVIGSVVAVKNLGLNEPQPTTDKGFQRNVASDSAKTPTPTTANNKSGPKNTPTPTATATKSPTPTSSSSTDNSTPTSTTTPTPTPTVTLTASTVKPTITITKGPYTSGVDAPCFDVRAEHPNCYELGARYYFNNEQPDQIKALTSGGACSYIGTICGSKTGGPHTFNVKARAISTNVESDVVSQTYTYP